MKQLNNVQTIIIGLLAIGIVLITLISLGFVGMNLTYYMELHSKRTRDRMEKDDCTTCDNNVIFRMSQEAIMLFNVIILIFVPILIATIYMAKSKKQVMIVLGLFLVLALLPKIASSISFIGSAKEPKNFIQSSYGTISGLTPVATYVQDEVINKLKKYTLYKFFTKSWKGKFRDYEVQLADHKNRVKTRHYCSFYGQNGYSCALYEGMSDAYDAELSHIIINTLLSIPLMFFIYKAA